MYTSLIVSIFINAYLNRHITKSTIDYIINNTINGIHISRSTLYKWVDLYAEDENFLNSLKASKFERKKIINILPNKKITPECEKFIIDKVTINPIINLKKLRNDVNDIFCINVSTNCIFKTIKRNNLTYKTI